MSFASFSRECLPAVEAEMRSVLASVEAMPGEDLYLDMLRYHLGWLDERLQPCAADAGKRIRPASALLACAASGKSWDTALPSAAAVELIHNFSLIHDDIQDHSDLRRGRPAVWKLWGMPLAINAGDAMFTLAHLALHRLAGRGLPASGVAASLEALDLACLHLTQGQHLDLTFEQRDDVTVDEYLTMIAGKTAALTACALQLGALAGGASPGRVKEFYLCGHCLGLAFQVLDDILGIWGDAAVTGKSAATDVESRKKSLPVLYALARDPDLRALYAAHDPSPAATRAILARIDATGARAYAAEYARVYSDRALEHLRAAQPAGPAAADLEDMTAVLLQRQR